jgi:cysteine desulfurase
MSIKLPIYLDYQATTPIDPRVLDAMMPYLTTHFGNPHSVEHGFGWQAETGVDIARRQIANLINADPQEIIFTSGATESNNIALKGTAYANFPAKNHIITVKTEHECVLGCARALELGGFEITYLDVDEKGLLDLRHLAAAITNKTSLISVMAINNEIGVIQNIHAIGEICKRHNVIFHTDAAQAVGKIPLDVQDMNIHLLSISGHKMYGPKGIGALYVRKDTSVLPLFDGGGQEQGLRSGTLSPALCAGLGKASEIAEAQMGKDLTHIEKLSDRFLSLLLKKLNCVTVNGSMEDRFKGNLNLTFNGIKSDLLVSDLKNIAISTGSACSSAKHRSSYVLESLGLTQKQIASSIRFGIGRMTTEEDINFAAEHIIQCVRNLS